MPQAPCASRPAAPLYHYVVVRDDLPRGIASAQIVHAADESVEERVPKNTHAVVLTVPDEPALWRLRTRLETTSARFVCVVEDDAPYTGQFMAIGFAPARKEVIGRHLSRLPLLR